MSVVLMMKEEPNPDELQLSFEDFWKMFPKRVARKDAMKAWAKVSPREYPKIIRAIEQQKMCDDWTDQGGKFIPYPASWLNGERWYDEMGTDLTMGECMWNCNGTREAGPKCSGPGSGEKRGTVYCAKHLQMVN